MTSKTDSPSPSEQVKELRASLEQFGFNGVSETHARLIRSAAATIERLQAIVDRYTEPEKRPTWVELWDANLRLAEKVETVTRDLDAARAVAEMAIDDVAEDGPTWGGLSIDPDEYRAKRLAELRNNVVLTDFRAIGDWASAIATETVELRSALTLATRERDEAVARANQLAAELAAANGTVKGMEVGVEWLKQDAAAQEAARQ